MRKDLEERKIQTTVRTKWLQLAEAEGYEDIDAFIESLQATLDRKQLQYQQMLEVRDKLLNIISEAKELLEKIKEAKQLEIFLPQIDEFLQKTDIIP